MSKWYERHWRPLVIAPVRLAACVLATAVIGTMPARADGTGRASICLTGENVHLDAQDQLDLPRAMVFDSIGVNTGNQSDFKTWDVSEDSNDFGDQRFITLEPIHLTAAHPCADAKIKSLVTSYSKKPKISASENVLFQIHGLYEFPATASKPKIPLDDLAHNGGLSAIVIEDATARVADYDDPPERVKNNCHTAGLELSQKFGMKITFQNNIMVKFENATPNNTGFFLCPMAGQENAAMQFYWEKTSMPMLRNKELIAKTGSFVAGIPESEVTEMAESCFSQSLRKDKNHLDVTLLANGVEYYCRTQTDDEDPHGTIIIRRRYGRAPSYITRQPSLDLGS